MKGRIWNGFVILLGCLCLAAEFGISTFCFFSGINEPKPWRSYFEFSFLEFSRAIEFGLVTFVPLIAGIVLISYHHGFTSAWRSACKITFVLFIPVLIWSAGTLCLSAGSDTQGTGEKPPLWLTQPLIRFAGNSWWILVFFGIGFWWLNRDMKRAVGHGVPLAFWKVYDTPETIRKFYWLACTWSVPIVWGALVYLTAKGPNQ